MTTTTSSPLGDTAEQLLADAIGCRRSERAAAAEMRHQPPAGPTCTPPAPRDTAATFTCRGDDTQIPIGGGSGWLVDAMAVAEFGGHPARPAPTTSRRCVDSITEITPNRTHPTPTD